MGTWASRVRLGFQGRRFGADGLRPRARGVCKA